MTSGALVVGPERVECSPCSPADSHVLITLETTCEGGVEWSGHARLIDHTSAVNLMTQEHFAFEDPLGAPGELLWHVAPDEPRVVAGPRLDLIVTEPGEYAFRVELLFDLMAAEFEGTIE